MRVATWALLFLAVPNGPSTAYAQVAASPSDAHDLAALRDKARNVTEPGDAHKVLQRFVGTWDTETTRLVNGESSPPEKGSARITWLIPYSWLKLEANGIARSPLQTFAIIGYDSFKRSFVITSVVGMDSVMSRAEGNLAPDGKALVAFGALDESLEGEHDKMVKYVWTFVSSDHIVMEAHGLPASDIDAPVVRLVFVRRR